MYKLKIGYFIGGLATGLILLFNFLTALPDGKLHIVFCDVGQGDAAYVRFPNGRDMLVDGGPNNKVLGCLGKHMPFWDRTIDLVILSHPQKDHMQGLLSVFERYSVGYFIRSDVENMTDGYEKLTTIVKQREIKEKFVTTGERIAVGQIAMNVMAPSRDVLGASTNDINESSVIFVLRYGTFDALFTGDATMRLSLDEVELLKVPHHGSKTGFTSDYIQALKPELAVISVGQNTFGHPTKEILDMLAVAGSRVLRTDQDGDIEIVSDGTNWSVH